MHKKLENVHKKFNKFKNIIPQTKENKRLKNKVLINAGNLYNDFYFIYKNKYVEEINSLDTENKKKLDYKKLRQLWVPIWKRRIRRNKWFEWI